MFRLLSRQLVVTKGCGTIGYRLPDRRTFGTAVKCLWLCGRQNENLDGMKNLWFLFHCSFGLKLISYFSSSDGDILLVAFRSWHERTIMNWENHILLFKKPLKKIPSTKKPRSLCVFLIRSYRAPGISQTLRGTNVTTDRMQNSQSLLAALANIDIFPKGRMDVLIEFGLFRFQRNGRRKVYHHFSPLSNR